MAETNDKPAASGPAEKASGAAAVGPDPLEDLRTAIGEVDAALVDLLNRRAALSLSVAQTEIGSVADAVLIRRGKTITVKVAVGRRPENID